MVSYGTICGMVQYLVSYMASCLAPYMLPIGKSSKNIKFTGFPMKVKNSYIVRIYILTMATYFWSIFHGKTLLKSIVTGWPW